MPTRRSSAVLRPDEHSAAALEQCLSSGGLALIPTDTVYGLACEAQSPAAIRRIYELKGRSPLKPSAVMFFSLQAALAALPGLSSAERSALRALLPGPVTLLLPYADRRFRYAGDPAAALGGAATGLPSPEPPDPGSKGQPLLGLRVPALSGCLRAFASIDLPLLQSSANRSGEPDCRRLEDVPERIRAGVDLQIDGGRLGARASTVIDLGEYAANGRWRIVREGPLGEAELQARLNA